ncbi:MAG TPA: TIGR03364 family FAD-dependent oxidoreductase [Bryobacteraceae bacterium]|jgi:FAD dependent oxidoreductase TIGR03364|nr:TIGR03364 family FAD-dependent oxidoreductase [Bryobacteraceae bacterium]
MLQKQFDLAIAGAGIMGLAHAYLAAKSGLKVGIFERNPAAIGASIRNFGMIWPIGQPAGALHETALRSREIWLDILREAGLPYQPTGSLHAAYRADEAAVGSEFADKAPGLGYDCAWLSAKETAERSFVLNPDGLLGALWSPVELTVDPRLVISRLPAFLNQRYGVEFHFNTAVQDVTMPVLTAGQKTWRADTVLLAGGDDYQTLFPEMLALFDLKRCKLQMMRTAPQPQNWQLGPCLAFGLTFRHYPAFEICESLPALAARIAEETPEFDRWGIHVMVSATADGALTLGDSHQYALSIDIFDRPEIDQLILDYARRYVQAPTLEIAETWHGIYAKHPGSPYIRYSPAPNVHGIIVTSGIGMTLSFGLAEQTLAQIGVAV